MSDPDNTPTGGKQDWEGFREVDRAIAENRLTSYTWKKIWADPWERRGIYLFAVLFLAFVVYVIIYDGLI
ncbi:MULTISPECIES: hypothetical protein [Sphingomonadaceae]|uniref:hypothetical protein n=1 Tax=Sphingomonadales TaxID=204457 RepID=UPI001650EDA8|nr:hypothetical protein [Novosphingopyxis iocasae]